MIVQQSGVDALTIKGGKLGVNIEALSDTDLGGYSYRGQVFPKAPFIIYNPNSNEPFNDLSKSAVTIASNYASSSWLPSIMWTMTKNNPNPTIAGGILLENGGVTGVSMYFGPISGGGAYNREQSMSSMIKVDAGGRLGVRTSTRQLNGTVEIGQSAVDPVIIQSESTRPRMGIGIDFTTLMSWSNGGTLYVRGGADGYFASRDVPALRIVKTYTGGPLDPAPPKNIAVVINGIGPKPNFAGIEFQTSGIYSGEIVQNDDGNMYYNAANNLFLRPSGTGVSIGNITPTAKLDIDGQIRIRGGSPGANKVLTSDANGLASWQPASGGGYWAANGNDIYNTNTGNVGIGINTPGTKLEVYNNSLATDEIFRLSRLNATNPTTFRLGTDSGLVVNNSGQDVLTIKSNNFGEHTSYNLGIRTSYNGDPLYPLVVNSQNSTNGSWIQILNGDASRSGTPHLDGLFLGIYGDTNYWDGTSISDSSRRKGNVSLWVGEMKDIIFITGAKDPAGGERLRITAGGNIGIGTNDPQYKLDVNGDINVTGDIRKNGTAYPNPDYVFEKDYKLLNLDELQGFVLANKHLPGMPSTEEISKDGIKLFEQNRLTLEKLEEAYLYIFQLEERIKKLENK